jgi:5-methylcytosine-specific restriction endonuclease McrA
MVFRDKAKQRYHANKDNINKKRKRSYEKRRKEWDKKYDKTIKGKLRRAKSNRKRKVQVKFIMETFTAKEWETKVIETKGYCPKCKKKVGIENLTLDHIYPISKAEQGRVYTIKDVQPLCMGCNASKQDFTLPSKPKEPSDIKEERYLAVTPSLPEQVNSTVIQDYSKRSSLTDGVMIKKEDKKEVEKIDLDKDAKAG